MQQIGGGGTTHCWVTPHWQWLSEDSGQERRVRSHRVQLTWVPEVSPLPGYCHVFNQTLHVELPFLCAELHDGFRALISFISPGVQGERGLGSPHRSPWLALRPAGRNFHLLEVKAHAASPCVEAYFKSY